MIATYRLVDCDAVDAWVRSVQEQLAAALAATANLHCEWLLLRCADTLRYDSADVKYASFLHLIDEVEGIAAEAPGLVAADVTTSARALVADAERRRFLNG